MPEPEKKKIDYSVITESPGLKATEEQMARLYQRYCFAKIAGENKDILEVGCGSGMGLGYLAHGAKSVMGIDVDEKNVKAAKKYYYGQKAGKGRSPEIEVMDAHKLSFPEGSFDLVLLFETIYYLREPERVVDEACRVLRDRGNIIICTVNKDWKDFHPSPYTHKYFSVPELERLLRPHFTDIRFYGGFRVEKGGFKSRLVSFIKHAALKLNLIPGDLGARAYLKRIFIGKLYPLPEGVKDGMASYEEPIEISNDMKNGEFKIIYAVAKRGRAR